MEKLKMRLIAEDFEEEPFYEDIEAPKFVDFTRSDPFLPDDRYWFCSRVGCDLKHEEELDLEAIYKSFALRAMAARSPNLRFQKALSKRQNENKKCPLSAPPKPSKPRISKLALLSSVSRKLVVDAKDTIQTPSKPTSTPKARVKHVAAKYMTTPRVKNPPVADSKPFNSVNQPKTTSRISKSKLVAKVLSFSSPKKAVKAKTLEKPSTTPITKLCNGMKKLEITEQKKSTTGELRSKKKVIGNTKTREANEKSSTSVKTKKVLGDTKTREADEKFSRSVKSKKVLGDTKTREENGKSSRSVNSKIKGVAQKKVNTKSVLCEVRAGDMSSQGNDINATDISCSSGPCSESSKPENGEVSVGTPKCGSNSSQQTTEERVLVETEKVGSEAQRTDENHSNEESGNDQNLSNDEKENAPFCDLNRDLTVNHGQAGENNGVKHETFKKSKGLKTINKSSLKENRSGCAGSQGVKNKKPKLTNPMPFRLRTDERSILKEATLERKQQHEDENQIKGEMGNCIYKSKKNQEALMRTKTPSRSASTKDKLASCKDQQKDANTKFSSSTRLTTKSLQKREQRTLQKPTTTPKSCTR